MFSKFFPHAVALIITTKLIYGQYTLTGPTSAAEGSTVTFTCTTSPEPFAVSWRETSGSNTNNYIYFYNSSEEACQYSSGASPSDYTFDCNSTVFILSFTAVYSRHNDSVFECKNGAGPGRSNNITLSVTVPLVSVALLNVTNPSLTALQGTEVTLVCATNPTEPESTISWRRDGQPISQGVTSSTRREHAGVVTISNWSHSINWTDRGIYICEALNSGVTRTSQYLTLIVQVPVSSVTLTNITSNKTQVPVNQDSSLVLTCQTSPAYPAPTVMWYVRSRMTWSGVDNRTETQTTGQIVTVSTMTRTMRKTNDQDTFYCRAENIDREAETQSKTARANVFYGPDAKKVNLTKPVAIAERNNVTLTCKTLTPVNPEVDFTWSWGDNTSITAGLGNKTGVARGSWSQTLTVTAVRDSNRQDINCDVINTRANRSERVYLDLDVSFGPDSGEVQVGKSSTAVELEPLSLTCSTTNNVKPGVTFTWTVDGSGVTTGTGVIEGSSGGKWSQTLTLTANRNQSSVGCTVINTVIARQESSSVDLDVNYPPDISLTPVEGPQNTDVTLTCTATGNPSNYRFEDFRQYWGDQLIQRREGNQTGDRYSLDLPQVTYQDSGVYMCTVGNNVKQPSHKNTTITVQASPVYTKDVDLNELVGAEIGQTARLVQYIYCNPNFTSVSWHFNTTNTTNRLRTDSSRVSSSLVHLDVYGSQVEVAGFKLVYTVNNFQQEHVGLYTVRVCNSVGCAESSLKLIASEPKVPPDSPLPLGAIAGGVVGGFAFFILVASLLVFLKRRKLNKGGDRERLGSNGRNGEIVMSDVHGAEASATENAVVVYAEVKKKKKTVTDVYTEVKKPNKGQQKKEITTAAKTKRARDDVYENAVPRQYGNDTNTYANAGFDGDEPETNNENTQPPIGRDADGCLYVGIDFGNKKPGKVIIGKEKGSYVDIAYGKVGPPPPPDEDDEDEKKK